MALKAGALLADAGDTALFFHRTRKHYSLEGAKPSNKNYMAAVTNIACHC